jgi:signal peptidase
LSELGVIIAGDTVGNAEGDLMESPPQASNTPAPIDADHPRDAPARSPLHTLGRIGSWLIVVAASLVVLGLLVVSIGPRFLPYQALIVRSGSMSPTIPTGSIVFYHKEAASKVKVGNIIVFTKPGDSSERVTHRVVKIGTGPTGKYFQTKGDANGAADDWQIPAVGTGWVESFHISRVGYALVDLQSGTARLLLLLIPAVLLGLITLYELVRDRSRRA